ncbi:hypothetical protein CASFOL_033512 [Castilleja foliolosa]|uniref:Uncharacterized protein n=1 Tax=Castilleja foliolosa TaxID=1961234 RepID=A0ABD3BX72_9LAMI
MVDSVASETGQRQSAAATGAVALCDGSTARQPGAASDVKS